MRQREIGAKEIIAEMSLFPQGKRDDLTDSVTRAISYPRNSGLAQTDEETRAEENERVTHGPHQSVWIISGPHQAVSRRLPSAEFTPERCPDVGIRI
jgi:hypothetical protein